MNCSCISCDKIQNKDCELSDENTAELPTNLFNILHPSSSVADAFVGQDDVPDLIHLPNRNRSALHPHEMNFTIEQQNEKLIKLLRSMLDGEGEMNISYDRKLIKELLELLERHKDEFRNVDLMQFLNLVNMHNSEKTQVDLSRLRQFLYAFKRNKYNNSADLDLVEMGAENNEQIGDDLKKYEVPNDFGIEGNRGGMTYQKGSHIAGGIVDNTISTHHHYVGEEQQVGSETGHLMAGPHGSLVLTPDTLQPNREGLVISYENHPKNHHKIVLDEE